MEIPALVINGFRRLLNTKGYKAITIADICTEANISKNTFYRYYENKLQVTAALLHEDLIAPTQNMKKILDTEAIKSIPHLLLERSYQIIFENRQVYERLLLQMGKSELIELWTEVVLSYSQPYFANLDLTVEESEFGAYFIAAAQAQISVHWIENNFSIEPNRLAKLIMNYLWAYHREIEVFPKSKR